MNGLPKACVILGAGASKDVYSDATLRINPELVPPLAKDLFNVQSHNVYWDILKPYPGAQFIAQLLEKDVTSGKSIEQALKFYATHKDHQIRQHFKQVPAYLRDLLYRSSTEYINAPSNYISLVYELLAQNPHEVLFIVLNYDTLLEQALANYNPAYYFSSMSNYINPSRPAKVVKLHGSINWFKRLGVVNSSSWTNYVQDLDLSEKVSENQMIISDDVRYPIASSVDHGFCLYPILTAPLAGKGTSEAVCPNTHIEFAREFLSTCSKFMIIGNSGSDTDLLSLLDNSILPKAHAYVHLVDFREATDDALNHFKKGVKPFGHSYCNLKIFRDGFRQYISSDAPKSFFETPNA